MRVSSGFQHKLFKFALIALVPVILSACSSKQDLGDSDGMTIGQPDDLSATDYAQTEDQYGNAPLGSVDSSTVPGTQADLAAQAGNDIIYYDTDRYDLNDEARRILEAQARWLNQYPNLNVTIEGHADERGTREYNLALGDRRAASAKNFLIAMGVDPRRVNTISYGKEQPLVVGEGGTYWSQNRRAFTRVE